MANEKGRKRRQKKSTSSEPNPMTPVSLTPMELRNEPAKSFASKPFEARDTPMVSIGDHAPRSMHVSEQRYDFAPLQALRPELRKERSLEFKLRPITVSPVQMQQLRDRRVNARELGWVIPGHRIRIGK